MNVLPHYLLHPRYIPYVFIEHLFLPQSFCLLFGVPFIQSPSSENVPQPDEVIYSKAQGSPFQGELHLNWHISESSPKLYQYQMVGFQTLAYLCPYAYA